MITVLPNGFRRDGLEGARAVALRFLADDPRCIKADVGLCVFLDGPKTAPLLAVSPNLRSFE